MIQLPSRSYFVVVFCMSHLLFPRHCIIHSYLISLVYCESPLLNSIHSLIRLFIILKIFIPFLIQERQGSESHSVGIIIIIIHCIH